jgi:chromosome segregation ATPase
MDEEKSLDASSIDPDEDIFEVLRRKGDHPSLSAFKHEYVELQKAYDGALAQVTSREREVEAAAHELHVVREQINFTNRNVEELVSAREALEDGIEHKK